MIQLEPPRTAWDFKLAVLRIPVRIHPAFWLGAFILGYQRNDSLGMIAAKAGCVLFSLLVHEFGHALSGRLHGDRGNYVVLYFCYGLCVPDNVTQRRGQRIIEMFWGPLAGFVLSGMAFGVLWASSRGMLPPLSANQARVVDFLWWINLIWSALNLVPVYPLDGGQIMREAILWKAPQRGNIFAFTVSLYVALVAAMAGVGLFFAYSPTFLFLGLLFALLAYSNWSLLKQIREYGGMEDEEEQRQPWEQDADWWKK